MAKLSNIQNQYDTRFRVWDFKEEYKKLLTDFGSSPQNNGSKTDAYRIKSDRGNSPLSSARKSPHLKEKKGEIALMLTNMQTPADEGSPRSIKKGSIAQITAYSSPRKGSEGSSIMGQFNRSFQKKQDFLKLMDPLGMQIQSPVDKSHLRTHDEGHSIEDLVKLNIT